MITSMTGYAEAAVCRGDIAITVELRSVNSRFLDLSLKMPYGGAELEERARALITRRIERGRVEAKVRIDQPAAAGAAFEIDLPRARAAAEALQRLNAELGLGSPPSLELVVGVGGVLKPAASEPEAELLWPLLEEALEQALDGLEAMRRQEGGHIAADLTRRLEAVRSALEAIRQEAAGLLPLAQERLKERLAALTQGVVELDPARIAQEAAFLADRSDISEEIVRAESHLNQFHAIMAAPEPAGRRLNFLLQELNREFNTMGSKIGSAAAAHRVVEVKSELEKIREQVQNIA
jgi:uncharacterized protein (TIGR00255 family)